MEKEFVSIVMLCYNHEKYLEKALDSVLMQETKYSYKIVIGDDCSPDRSQEIIKNYVRQYPNIIHAICRQKNLGMNENFIDLIHRCEGKYIAYLECDDYWTDNQKLQKQVEFLETHPQYSAVTAQTRCVDQDGQTLREKMFDFKKAKDFNYFDLRAFKQPGHMSTWVMRNEFKEGIYDIARMLDYKHSTGDRILPILLLSRGKIHCMPDLVSCYRFDLRPDSTSWSSKHDKALRNGNLEDFERLEQLEAYAVTLSYPIQFTKKKVFYYGLALYYAYIHKNKGYRNAKKDMVRRMHHNIRFILAGYYSLFLLIINSVIVKFKRKKISSKATSLDLSN